MRRFQIVRSTTDTVTSYSGVALVGRALARTRLDKDLGQIPLRHGIAHADCVTSYIGLVSTGKVTPANVGELGQRLRLRCNGCGHDVVAEPRSFGVVNNLRLDTPMLRIARRLVCTRCSARKAHCWPELWSVS